jgi:hypothetical protein
LAILVGGLTLPGSGVIWIHFMDNQPVYTLDVLKVIVFGGLDLDIVMEPLNFWFWTTGH